MTSPNATASVPVYYVRLSLSGALALYRRERPTGRGITVCTKACRTLCKSAVICTVGKCQLVYVPARLHPSRPLANKLGCFYLRSRTLLDCALSIPPELMKTILAT